MDALLNRILVLCKGDKAKAKALLDNVKTSHPGQEALWYLMKVIQDLEQQQADYFRRRRSSPVAPPARPQPSPPTSIHHKASDNLSAHPIKQASYKPQTEKKSQPSGERKPAPYRFVRPNLAEPGCKAPPPPPSKKPEPIQNEDLNEQLRARQRELQRHKVSPPSPTPVSSHVQNKLFRLSNGDMRTANRLLEHTRKANPLRSEQWVWEKVVFDLERDRH